MKLRYYLALWVGKLSVFGLRLLKRQGTVLPGRIALAICPSFIRLAARPETVIAVTGANGKTTVTNMLTDLLKADGRRVLSNPSGANEHDGCASTPKYTRGFCGERKAEGRLSAFKTRSVEGWIAASIRLAT